MNLPLSKDNPNALLAVVCLPLLLLYLAFPTMNYYWDGIAFSHAIEQAGSPNTSLVHPNHLLYNSAGYFFSVKDNLSYTLRGHFRLFVSGRLSLLKGLFSPFVVLLVAAFGVCVALLIFAFIKKLETPATGIVSSLKSDLKKWAIFELKRIWTVVDVAFLFFWLPQKTFYRLFYLPEDHSEL